MDDFIGRLKEERVELEEKLNKLNAFNQSEKFKTVGDDQRSLLLIQAGAMYTYLECLKARLDRL